MPNSYEAVVVPKAETAEFRDQISQDVHILLLALTAYADDISGNAYYDEIQTAVNGFNGSYGTPPTEYDRFVAQAFPSVAYAKNLDEISRHDLQTRIEALIDRLSAMTSVPKPHSLSMIE